MKGLPVFNSRENEEAVGESIASTTTERFGSPVHSVRARPSSDCSASKRGGALSGKASCSGSPLTSPACPEVEKITRRWNATSFVKSTIARFQSKASKRPLETTLERQSAMLGSNSSCRTERTGDSSANEV